MTNKLKKIEDTLNGFELCVGSCKGLCKCNSNKKSNPQNYFEEHPKKDYNPKDYHQGL